MNAGYEMSDVGSLNKYIAGFNECKREVSKYLASVHGLGDDAHACLLGHLAKSLQHGDENTIERHGGRVAPQTNAIERLGDKVAPLPNTIERHGDRVVPLPNTRETINTRRQSPVTWCSRSAFPTQLKQGYETKTDPFLSCRSRSSDDCREVQSSTVSPQRSPLQTFPTALGGRKHRPSFTSPTFPEQTERSDFQFSGGSVTIPHDKDQYSDCTKNKGDERMQFVPARLASGEIVYILPSNSSLWSRSSNQSTVHEQSHEFISSSEQAIGIPILPYDLQEAARYLRVATKQPRNVAKLSLDELLLKSPEISSTIDNNNNFVAHDSCNDDASDDDGLVMSSNRLVVGDHVDTCRPIDHTRSIARFNPEILSDDRYTKVTTPTRGVYTADTPPTEQPSCTSAINPLSSTNSLNNSVSSCVVENRNEEIVPKIIHNEANNNNNDLDMHMWRPW